MNRHVQITTTRGIYKGKIIKVDKEKVYLQVSSPDRNRKKAYTSFFFAPLIIPLVLFDLLVIVLLDRRSHRIF
jgi:hypothetical protein